MLDQDRNERVIKVADIAPHYRHKVILQLFEHLDPEQSLQLPSSYNWRLAMANAAAGRFWRRGPTCGACICGCGNVRREDHAGAARNRSRRRRNMNE